MKVHFFVSFRGRSDNLPHYHKSNKKQSKLHTQHFHCHKDRHCMDMNWRAMRNFLFVGIQHILQIKKYKSNMYNCKPHRFECSKYRRNPTYSYRLVRLNRFFSKLSRRSSKNLVRNKLSMYNGRFGKQQCYSYQNILLCIDMYYL